MKLNNASGGVIVLPTGQEVAADQSFNVEGDGALASGIAALIKSGGLVDVKAAAKAKATDEQAEAEAAAKAKATDEQAKK